MPDTLITDRTQTDVTNKTSKAYWNVVDITRINEWNEYLSDIFGLIPTITDYILGKEITSTLMDNVLTDVDNIRTGHTWATTPTTPSKTAWNYVKANNIEQILYDANLWKESRFNGYRYCGTFTCGTEFEL